MSKQYNVYILTKSNRDYQSIDVLGRQIMGKSKDFVAVYRLAIAERKFPFLLVDLEPATDDELKLRGSLPFETPLVVYRPG